MKNEFYKITHSILFKTDSLNSEIQYILTRKKDDEVEMKSYVSAIHDPEIMYCITGNVENNHFFEVAPWDFNIEDYLFEDLENGFEISYMSIEEHYNFWCAIDEWKNEIQHTEGLQKYLSYCQKNNITADTLDALGLEHVDVMNLYRETNAGFNIIASMNCGNQTIVLGQKISDKNEFVTWETTPNRKRGFYCGHYTNSYKSAMKDYQNRCRDMLDSKLRYQKNFFDHLYRKDKGVER